MIICPSTSTGTVAPTVAPYSPGEGCFVQRTLPPSKQSEFEKQLARISQAQMLMGIKTLLMTRMDLTEFRFKALIEIGLGGLAARDGMGQVASDGHQPVAHDALEATLWHDNLCLTATSQQTLNRLNPKPHNVDP